MPELDDLAETVANAFEAARISAIEQLTENGFPTSLRLNRMLIVDNDERTGWQSQWEEHFVSGLHDRAASLATRDTESRFASPSFHEQLMPLAECQWPLRIPRRRT